MEGSPREFLTVLRKLDINNTERGIALLWWHGLKDHSIGVPTKQLCLEIEQAGYAKQNVTRMAENLAKDPRTTKGTNGSFRIKITTRERLNQSYLQHLRQHPIEESDSILPTNLFTNTRGYIEKVVLQINASYDSGLYDCCTVMCRRLLETLIIEVYEAKGFADDLKGSDGHYKMFSGLLAQLEKEKRFNLSRNSLEGLKNFKRLGDESAHNRRFNARKEDIDRIRDGMRVAAEDLLHLANLA
ncbi:MAG: hypothetical protein HY562_10355 [Ignavibacteriales bacterium]|nr:hypothetical protein [Ignavibacteriales bacterium]